MPSIQSIVIVDECVGLAGNCFRVSSVLAESTSAAYRLRVVRVLLPSHPLIVCLGIRRPPSSRLGLRPHTMFLVDVYCRPWLRGLVVVPLFFLMVALLVATVVGKGHRVLVLIIEDLID